MGPGYREEFGRHLWESPHEEGAECAGLPSESRKSPETDARSKGAGAPPQEIQGDDEQQSQATGFENLVKRDFDIDRPDQVYAADITYVWTQEGWLYLAVVIDLCTRKVVGWSMSSRMKTQLVCDALQMAIWRRQPKAGLIHHSDRGSQYASKAFRRLLKAHGIEGSMSRKGDCWDNAVVESFFGTLKQERVQWRNYQSRYEAQQDILDYISMFYNSRRLHSHLGYMSPNDFERQLTETKKAA